MRKLARDLERTTAVVLLMVTAFLGYQWVNHRLHPVVPDHPVALGITKYQASFDGAHPFLAGMFDIRDPGTVARFVSDLNAMQPLDGEGNSSCPQYRLGWYDLLRFRYPDRSIWTVEVLIGRCGQPMVRANSVVWAPQSRPLLRDLRTP